MVFDTYRGGTSQHPMDGLAGGDGLIARVYDAIRQSLLWESSLLIITYDEHGGFYDSAAPTGAPPHPAPPPNDGTGAHQNGHKFDFSEFGVRVPAVIVSPWVAANSVDHTLYDHAAVLATVEQLFDLDPLTDQDKHANALLSLIGTTLRPDHDCLPPLPVGPVSPAAMAMTAADSHVDPDELIENSSDLASFMFVVRKADRERLGDLAAMTRFQPVASRADAQRYIDETVPKLEALRGTAAGTA